MQSVMDRDIDHILVSEEQLKTRVAVPPGSPASYCV